MVKIYFKNNYLNFIIGAAWLFAPGQAHALGSADYITLRSAASIRSDSNVQRLPDGVSGNTPSGPARSDIIRTWSVGATADIPLSRQRLLLSLDLNRTAYDKFTNLDFDGDAQRASLAWEAGPRATGDLGMSRSTNQTDLADSLGRRPNLRTTLQRFFSVNYPFAGEWRASGGLRQTESTNSDPFNRVNDNTNDSFDLGMRYEPQPGIYTGLRASRSAVSYPNPVVLNGVAANNGYSQDGLSFVAGYAPGGAGSVQLDLGRNNRVSDDPARGSFSGRVGNLNLAWAPTGRTALNMGFSREFGPSDDLVNNSSVIDTLRLGMRWRVTGKLDARADFSRQLRRFSLTRPALGAVLADRKDTTDQGGITFSYNPLRWLSLNLSLRDEQRESTLTGIDYTANVVGATAEVRF